MNENRNGQARTYKAREGLFSAISVGAVFVLIGIIYAVNLPNSLWESILEFLSNLAMSQVPNAGISLLAPTSPAAHTVLYGAVFQFCIGLGILQVILLSLRLTMHSQVGKTAEAMGNLVYWFGAGYLVATYLNSATELVEWFAFWAGILIILGLSFIARWFVLLVKRK